MALSTCAWADEPEVSTTWLTGKSYSVLLNPNAPADERNTLLVELQREARQRDGLALYTLGSLYRLGDEHPAHLVEKNLDKALLYLSNAAAAGVLDAMASASELELSRSNAAAAMVWAQLYVYYQKIKNGGESSDAIDQGYAAGLLYRCKIALGLKYDEEALVENVNAFILQFDEAVRSGGVRLRTDTTDLPKPLKSEEKSFMVWEQIQKQQHFRTSEPEISGMVDLLIGTDSSGDPQKILVIDSLPDQRAGKALAKTASNWMKYSSAADRVGLYWSLLRFELVDQRHQIR